MGNPSGSDRVPTGVDTLRAQGRRVAGPVAALAVAAVWLALGLNNPTLTYHFAPILGAAIWPIAARLANDRLSPATGAVAAVGGFVVTLAAGLVLVFTDSMEGPSL